MLAVLPNRESNRWWRRNVRDDVRSDRWPKARAAPPPAISVRSPGQGRRVTARVIGRVAASSRDMAGLPKDRHVIPGDPSPANLVPCWRCRAVCSSTRLRAGQPAMWWRLRWLYLNVWRPRWQEWWRHRKKRGDPRD